MTALMFATRRRLCSNNISSLRRVAGNIVTNKLCLHYRNNSFIRVSFAFFQLGKLVRDDVRGVCLWSYRTGVHCDRIVVLWHSNVYAGTSNVRLHSSRNRRNRH